MEIVFYVGLVGFILFGPWVLVWCANSKRKRDRREDQTRWAEVTDRIRELEREVQALRKQAAPVSEPERPADVTERKTVERPSAAPAVEVASSQPRAPSEAIAEAWVTRKAVDRPPDANKPRTQVPAVTAEPPAVVASSTPSFGTGDIRASLFDRFISTIDIEEMLGTDWLNKLGIILLVLGIAFFLAYQLKTMGPSGKVSVGFITAGVLLVAGIWLERLDRYRILARAGIGGGWALLFFTTYAMYHVPAAHVLDSQLSDLVLMLAVAVAMVLQTLRYRSQVVTGLAFLLALLTVTISHSNVYSLSAGVLLAGGLVVVVGHMQWFELEVFGILASYLNHFLWLRPIIEPMHGKRHPFQEFLPSAAILIVYWLVFRLSYVFRMPKERSAERTSTVSALLNTSLLLALLKYQSVHPEWAFWALLAMGIIETGLAQLPAARRRRTAVIVLSTLGIVLLIAAFPFRYSGTRLSVLWLAEAEALLLIGVWTKEIVFRRLGMIASVLVAGQMLGYDAAEIFGRRMDDADLRPDFALAVFFAVAGAVFYTNAHWVLRRWPEVFENEIDRTVLSRFSFAGLMLSLVAAWIAFPEAWTAVAWCGLALLLGIAARRLQAFELRYQATVLIVLAVTRVLAINLGAGDKLHGITIRLMTISVVAALLYITSRSRIYGKEKLATFDKIAGEFYSWAASFLLGLLAWYELRAIAVANAWAVGGLLLVEVGLSRKSPALRKQGYVALSASFLRIFFVNLNADGFPGSISPTFYTVVPLAFGFFYAYWRLEQSRLNLSTAEQKFLAPEIFCWLGTVSVGTLMRFELEADWVSAGWAALAFGLLAIAWRSGRSVFLYQGLLVVVGVLFRTVLHNFYERSYFPAPLWESRWVTAGAAIVLLLASLPIAFRLRRTVESEESEGIRRAVKGLGRHPEQLLFFVAIGLLTVLLALEMRHGMVTLSWGLEGVAVFLLALWLEERSFRLTGLGLLLLCVGKILVDDVWRLNPRDRYLTFIVLGGALLLVSFLYTRNREALRRYL